MGSQGHGVRRRRNPREVRSGINVSERDSSPLKTAAQNDNALPFRGRIDGFSFPRARGPKEAESRGGYVQGSMFRCEQEIGVS